MLLFACILFVYWIILLLKYEKDKLYPISNLNEEELFNKYNPLIAGCIQGNREVLTRDILAVVLGLIDKKIIKLEFHNELQTDNESYKYTVSKNIEKEHEMDEIEKYIYDWIFKSDKTINLANRLKLMTKDVKATEKFKTLNNIAEEKLAEYGANQKSVPSIIRGINILLLIVSIGMVIIHIGYNGFNIYSGPNLIALLMYLLTFIPILILPIEIILRIIVWIRHRIHKRLTKITGKKIITTTIGLVILLIGIIVISTLLEAPEYIIADEILIMMAVIIVLTDNLMMKNSVIIIEDHSKLNALKDKIEEYTMMEDRDIEQIELWEKYLVYAVSFGIADKIIARIKDIFIDDDLIKLVETDIMSQYIRTGYMAFYYNASLDRRFLRGFSKARSNIVSARLNARGRRRRIFRWRRFFWRRR